LRVADQAGVEGEGFELNAFLAALDTPLVIDIGPATVVVVLAKEAPEGEIVMVIHHRLGPVLEFETMLEALGTKVSILSPRPGEALVESPDGREALAREGDVVRGEEGGALRQVVLVDVVEQHLAGGGGGVVGERVHGVPAEHGVRSFLEALCQAPQPRRIGLAVVVGEGEKGAGRLRSTSIARGGGPSVLLTDHPQVE